MLQFTTNQKFWYPAAAAPTLLTPSAVANTNSAWTAVFTADSDSVLTDLVVKPATVDTPLVIETGVSTNGGSSYSVIDARKLAGMVDITGTEGPCRIRISPGVDAIPSGAIVGVRMRKAGTSTASVGFKIGILKKPIIGNVATTIYPGVAMPDISLFTLPGHATPWTWGAQLSLLASAPYNLALTSFCIPRWSNSHEFEIELFVNGSTFEMIRGYNTLVGNDLHYEPLTNPRTGILTGDVLTGRMRGNQAGASIYFGFTYFQV
jgi:hypothetical protein